MAFRVLERKATAWGVALFLLIVAADAILFRAVLENRGAVKYNLAKILENQAAIESNQDAIQKNQEEIRQAIGKFVEVHVQTEARLDSIFTLIEERLGTR